MQDLLIFVTNHWLLVGIFVILLVALLWVETQGKVSGLARLSPQQAIHLINRENAVIFDMRDKTQFNKGHIAHAINMSSSEIESKNLTKYKDKPVILVCGTGTNSPKFGTKFKQQGLDQLHFLQGGINAWKDANLPLVRKK